MTTFFVNRDWSAIVPEGSPDAAFGVQAKDLRRLGLADQVAAAELPDAEPEPKVLVMGSANAQPEPMPPADDTKQAPPPADKQAAKPANKAIRKPGSK